MAGDRRRRQPHHYDALSRATSGSIKISKATFCPEHKVAFFVAATGRFFRSPYVRFESGEQVCCEPGRAVKKSGICEEFAERGTDFVV